MTHKELWESVLVEMELSLSKANFSTWFKDTYIQGQDETLIYVATPNQFVKNWLQDKYHTTILRVLREKSDHSVRSIEYVVGSPAKKSAAEEETVVTGNELPLEKFYVNKENNLNPRYTFETFVIGAFNELAHAASQAVIDKPGMAYNPLFIYGPTGIGKTHMIQAIGNEIKKNNPDKKIFYLTSEKFAVDYINSLRVNKVNAFKEKYRKYDVLIMDDIQFLSKKEKTQEELFHLFNSMYDRNAQIIFSSDKHPNHIPNLEDRLRSRFSVGMIIDMPVPDPESRTAIVGTKAASGGLNLDDEVIAYIASNVKGNIREIEGAINSILLYSQAKTRQITINIVKKILKDHSKPKKTIAVKDLIKMVADFYNIEEESIYAKTRKKEVVLPRQLTMYILRNDYDISYPAIGQKIGGRDHTTVIHSCDKITRELETNQLLGEELEQIRTML